MTRLFKWILLFGLLLMLLGLGFALAVVESTPKVAISATEQIDDAESVNRLLQQFRLITKRRYERQNIAFSEQQLNSLAGFSQRALPEFSAQASIQADRLSFAASYLLPLGWGNYYINLQGALLAGNQLKMDTLQLGSISLSGDTALSLFAWFINWRTESDLGDMALAQVEALTIAPDHAVITLKPINELMVKLNQIKKGLAGNENHALRIRTAFYLAYLDEMVIAKQRAPVSLSRFIQPLFSEVSRRSASPDADPGAENESALLALAIFVGHHRIANLVGDVQPYSGKVVLPRYRPTLANRTDLTQHFVISAAIKILSMQGISNAIGEFKELMDRGQGGSGFSFADLAADMAGVELAMKSADPHYAIAIQQRLAAADHESIFFPAISGLPEGLSKEQFNQQFQQVESDAYQQVSHTIKQRIANLPIYQELE